MKEENFKTKNKCKKESIETSAHVSQLPFRFVHRTSHFIIFINVSEYVKMDYKLDNYKYSCLSNEHNFVFHQYFVSSYDF